MAEELRLLWCVICGRSRCCPLSPHTLPEGVPQFLIPTNALRSDCACHSSPLCRKLHLEISDIVFRASRNSQNRDLSRSYRAHRHQRQMSAEVAWMAHKQILFRSAAREKILRGATQLADAVRVTLGPTIEVGADREEVGRADRVQRWRHHRQGIRPQGPGGESRRPHAPTGRGKDRRHGRRRNQHLNDSRSRHICRRRAQRRGRRERDRHQARPRSCREARNRGSAGACRARSRRTRKRPRSAPFPRTTIPSSANSWPTPWTRSAARA